MRLQLISAFTLLISISSVCPAQDFNSRVAAYLQGKVGVRCGGGECAHAPLEALRASGAEFTRLDLGADSPAAGDFVWGTFLKKISIVSGRWTDSKPGTKLLAGDIIQFRNTKFVYPTSTTTAIQHTAVVATINSTTSMPTFVYQQNFAGVRTLQKSPIDLQKLTAGYLMIYRPKARVSRTGQTKFTITNNMTSSQTVSMFVGTSKLGSTSLSAANTLGSYQVLWATVTGTTSPITLKLSNGNSVNTINGGGYEIKSAAGAPAIRKLSP